MAAISPRPENVAPRVHSIRGERVLLDADLVLNQAVKRNQGRFPMDFMFRLSSQEWAALRSQIVTSNSSKLAMRSQSVTSNARGGIRYLPYAFTEQGIAMLSSILRSARAVEVNIAIMRTFVQLRRLMDGNRELARRFTS
jgi:hypothetical protein